VTWHWKALEESYIFGLDLIVIGLFSWEIWTLKVPGLQPRTVSGLQPRTFLGLQLGSLGKKSHLDVPPAVRRREYYMGEGGGFPGVQAMVSLVCPSARGLSQHPRVFPNAN